MQPPAHHRPMRSFVLRQGRMSDAQQRALELYLPDFGLPYQTEPLDITAAFGRQAPLVLEIGFGMGETTATIAAQHPDINYLGVEVHAPGVGSLLRQIAALDLTNLRIIQHDAVEVLTHMLPDACLDGIHVFFPDPWPKARHHKRRLLQPALVALLARKLKSGGYLHTATDWQNYAEHMLEVLSNEPQLHNSATDYAPRPDTRPLTKFEQRGLRLGHGVWDLLLHKR